MQYKMKIKCLFLNLLICILILCSCGNVGNIDHDIIGTWEYYSEDGNRHVYIFEEDGTIELNTAVGDAIGEYKINDNVIEYSVLLPNGKTKTSSIPYEVDGNELYLTTSPNHTYMYHLQ